DGLELTRTDLNFRDELVVDLRVEDTVGGTGVRGNVKRDTIRQVRATSATFDGCTATTNGEAAVVSTGSSNKAIFGNAGTVIHLDVEARKDAEVTILRFCIELAFFVTEDSASVSLCGGNQSACG
ncbi:MAG: hypothetical protein HN578_14875, partial [Rhodospirillales bacterium]|nr:hypothetical protein [Rhodospirillales bacterium]